ncbi:MAG: S1 RNA-binding domain-containing protein, partial [Acidobacteria bacterium]
MSVAGRKAEEGEAAAQVKTQEETPWVETPVVEAPVIESPKEMDHEEMQEAYDLSFKNIAEGAVVSGTILKISDSHVVVDVGFKSEGQISLDEFRDDAGNLTIKQGDKVDVLLERTEDRNGNVVVSRQKAERMKIWTALEKVYQA